MLRVNRSTRSRRCCCDALARRASPAKCAPEIIISRLLALFMLRVKPPVATSKYERLSTCGILFRSYRSLLTRRLLRPVEMFGWARGARPRLRWVSTFGWPSARLPLISFPAAATSNVAGVPALRSLLFVPWVWGSALTPLTVSSGRASLRGRTISSYSLPPRAVSGGLKSRCDSSALTRRGGDNEV